MSEDEIRVMHDLSVYKTRDKKVYDYVNITYKMYIDGIKLEMIFSYILKIGFKGTNDMLNNQMRSIIKNNFGINLPINCYLKYDYPENVTSIMRNEVLKYITTKKVKKTKQLKQI